MFTIAIAAQKGGTGKTTTARNLAAAAVRAGLRVLLIDADAQGSLTARLNVARRRPGLIDVLDSGRMADAVQTISDGLDFMPSTEDLWTYQPRGPDVLRDSLSSVESCQLCVVDSAPSLNMLALNVLTAANLVLIPTQADADGPSTVRRLGLTISTIRRYYNPDMARPCVLLTEYQPRAKAARLVLPELRGAVEDIGARLLNTVIRPCSAVRAADLDHKDIFCYNRRCNAAKDYAALLVELLAIIGEEEQH